MASNIKQIFRRSYLQKICLIFEAKIKKGQRIGFFVDEPEELKFQHVPCKTKAKKEEKSYTPKNSKADRRIFKSFMTLHMPGEIQLIKLQRLLPT